LKDMSVEKDKIVFKRTIVQRGTGISLQLPKELQEFLELEIGEEVSLMAETGKHGKFLAIWSNKFNSNNIIDN